MMMDIGQYGFSYTNQNFLDMEMDIDWQNIKFEFESDGHQVPCFKVHENNFSESQYNNNYGAMNVIQMDETSQDQRIGSEFDDFIEFNPDELIEEVDDDEDVKFTPPINHTNDYGPDTLYFCTTCTLDFPSLAYLKRHFNTKKHHRALAMQQRGKKFNQKRKYVRKNEVLGSSVPKANLKIVTDLSSEEIALLHGSSNQMTKIRRKPSAKDFYENFGVEVDSDSEEKKKNMILSPDDPHEIFKASSSQDYLRSNVMINNNYSQPEQVSVGQGEIIYSALSVSETSNDASQKPKHYCQWCKKVFNLRCHYTQHMNSVHSGDRNFKCYKCGKKYPSQEMLIIHMNKHTHIKPFKCNQCERSYNNKVDLKRHVKTHQDIKDHVCKICGNGFVRFDHLQKHYAVHQKKISMGLGDKIRSRRGLVIKNEIY